MDVKAVREEIAARLRNWVAELNVYASPPGAVNPVAAVVQPQAIDYDLTRGRGSDEIDLALIVPVGKPNDTSSHDRLDGYMSGSGDTSIKARLESGEYTEFDTIEVTRGEWDVVAFSEIPYLTGILYLTITGDGE